jgi:hypothetical protein
VLYSRFLPVLLADVLPQALTTHAVAPRSPASALWLAASRVSRFYGVVIPALAALGLWRLHTAPRAARRVLVAILVSGAGLLLLRYALPALFRDAKEIELLAAPLAVLSSAGLLWLAEHGLPGRVAASGVATGVFFWGAWRAIAAYLERFVAVGR